MTPLKDVRDILFFFGVVGAFISLVLLSRHTITRYRFLYRLCQELLQFELEDRYPANLSEAEGNPEIENGKTLPYYLFPC